MRRQLHTPAKTIVKDAACSQRIPPSVSGAPQTKRNPCYYVNRTILCQPTGSNLGKFAEGRLVNYWFEKGFNWTLRWWVLINIEDKPSRNSFWVYRADVNRSGRRKISVKLSLEIAHVMWRFKYWAILSYWNGLICIPDFVKDTQRTWLFMTVSVIRFK